MKILVAISLSLLVLFQSAGLCVSDFFMLKDLIEHAEYHSEEYGDNLITFFEKHYGSLKTEHQEQESQEQTQHENLPFQHSTSHQLLIEGIVSDYKVTLNKNTKINKVKSHFYYENHYSFLETTSILQPPQHT